MMPIRIHRQRIKGWKAPASVIYVGRPTIWGNPFRPWPSLYKTSWGISFKSTPLFFHYKSQHDAQAEAVRMFEKWFDANIAEPGSDLYKFREIYGWHGFQMATVAPHLLRGKDLMCWCNLNDPCHA